MQFNISYGTGSIDLDGRVRAVTRRAVRRNTLFVDASKRRGGIGTQLLVRATEKALALGCHVIDLVVDHSNEKGLAFYKKCGLVDNADIEQNLGHLNGGAKIFE